MFCFCKLWGTAAEVEKWHCIFGNLIGIYFIDFISLPRNAL